MIGMAELIDVISDIDRINDKSRYVNNVCRSKGVWCSRFGSRGANRCCLFVGPPFFHNPSFLWSLFIRSRRAPRWLPQQRYLLVFRQPAHERSYYHSFIGGFNRSETKVGRCQDSPADVSSSPFSGKKIERVICSWYFNVNFLGVECLFENLSFVISLKGSIKIRAIRWSRRQFDRR